MTLSEQIKRNKLTIDELAAVLNVLERMDLEQVERDEVVETAMAKIRWHIAASRNEVEYDAP